MNSLTRTIVAYLTLTLVRIFADQFSVFFNSTIDKIREEVDSAISGVTVSSYINSNHSNCSMLTFQCVTPEDLIKVIKKCPTKSCDLDPLPT